ncbi:MAG: hypothetical protein ACTSWP_01095 [Candidatus Freyarchaeota archaeon]|nr:hypothetical protein [Candidatus Freyrarchaeum guaymaensis]
MLEEMLREKGAGIKGAWDAYGKLIEKFVVHPRIEQMFSEALAFYEEFSRMCKLKAPVITGKPRILKVNVRLRKEGCELAVYSRLNYSGSLALVFLPFLGTRKGVALASGLAYRVSGVDVVLSREEAGPIKEWVEKRKEIIEDGLVWKYANGKSMAITLPVSLFDELDGILSEMKRRVVGKVRRKIMDYFLEKNDGGNKVERDFVRGFLKWIGWLELPNFEVKPFKVSVKNLGEANEEWVIRYAINPKIINEKAKEKRSEIVAETKQMIEEHN